MIQKTFCKESRKIQLTCTISYCENYPLLSHVPAKKKKSYADVNLQKEKAAIQSFSWAERTGLEVHHFFS